jgi:5-methylcytosine-specific restriction enzyme subunit McrC
VTIAPVTLDELDREGVVRPLDKATAAALTATRLVEVRPEFAGYRLLPCGLVGAVRVGDVQVQVTPKEKVGLSRLLFLLGYARDPGFQPEDVAGLDQPDTLAALAESLARQAERALSRGVLQGYQRVDDSLRTVRGRIRIGDQIARRPGLLIPLEVSYDEFTVDCAENRILRTAVRRMQSVPQLSDSARRRLAHLDARLQGVQVVRRGERRPRWQPTRMNELYRPALRLAEIVLDHLSAEVGDRDVQVAAFVVSMWQVFEDFVTTALIEAFASRPGRTETQLKQHLDVPHAGRPSAVAMRVDVVHVDPHGQPQLIFDAKYKHADSSGRYSNADYYQMLAYCTALGVSRAWLVYAQGSGRPVERHIVNTDVTVVEYPLDLRAPPTGLLRQVDELAAVAWAATRPTETSTDRAAVTA